jgi:geranylgeranyl pyrophosphate synthase
MNGILGKKAGADLELGLATAPVLFASREFTHLNTLINRYIQIFTEITTEIDTRPRVKADREN